MVQKGRTLFLGTKSMEGFSLGIFFAFQQLGVRLFLKYTWSCLKKASDTRQVAQLALSFNDF